jgi:hypothetical protein
MPEKINLADCEGLHLELTDKDDQIVLSIDLIRGVEDLPQLHIKRFTAEGELDSLTTIFDVKA